MGKKDNFKRENKIQKDGKEKKKEYILTLWTKKWIKAILMFVTAIIVVLSFVAKAGQEALAEFAQVHAISAQTIDPDFERNPRIHRAWELRRLDETGRSGREGIKLGP